MRNQKPTISCIIPVFNGEAYLGEALESILTQTYPVDEIIVVDDGSTDNTPAVIEEFAESITSARQENKGPAAARNRGIQMANGDWISMQDADDLWHPEKIELQAHVLFSKPHVQIVITKVRNFWIPELAEEERRLKNHRFTQILPGYIFQTMLARAQVFNMIGMLDENLGLLCDDTDWFLRARDGGVRIELLDKALVNRRLHHSNISRMLRAQSNKEALLGMISSSLQRRRSSGK